MPIAFPDAPQEGPQQTPEPAPRRPDERERTRTRPRARTREDDQAPTADSADSDPADADDQAAGQVVPFPGAGPVVVAEPGAALVLRETAREWLAEAGQTAAHAVDGTVWRARPPALRDSAARLQRAEWSGGVPLLRWLGWIYGYPALGARAVLLGLAWLLDHPSRLLVAAAITAVALYLH
ncbi:hypothetical protein DZF91_24140 [Actinomadura logoneensis]|uniref:Uncharacterized protein n=1 Tax=Actinomadura logoneensis TaxID=2293572 RepID=A0A372JGM0_9ACTN|nr:hypothetical protein [Actinomadura logoneensis]RFU39110.1 hypothetical protein DZF91_24140 [Actinomadura logoneensis]